MLGQSSVDTYEFVRILLGISLVEHGIVCDPVLIDVDFAADRSPEVLIDRNVNAARRGFRLLAVLSVSVLVGVSFVERALARISHSVGVRRCISGVVLLSSRYSRGRLIEKVSAGINGVTRTERCDQPLIAQYRHICGDGVSNACATLVVLFFSGNEMGA